MGFSFRAAGHVQGDYVDLVRDHATEGMIVAEIGTYDGITTCAALPIVKSFNGKYIAIDWFLGTKNPDWENVDHPHYYDPDQGDATYNRFVNNIKEGGWEEMTTVIRSDSAEAASQIPDRSLDICFIDGDHRYSKVSKDIELYLPKVKDGGLIVFDDCEKHGILRSEPDWFERTKAESGGQVNGDIPEGDGHKGVHWGVVQAVCDVFDHDIARKGGATAYKVLDDKTATNERYLEIRKLT